MVLEVGQVFEGLRVAIADASVRTTTAGKPFLQATVAVGGTRLTAMYWDFTKTAPKVDEVYKVAGKAGTYNGKLQLTLTSMEFAVDQSLDDFMPKWWRVENSHVAPENMIASINQMIREIKTPSLQHIVKYVINENVAEFMRSTAAIGMHHVGINGLLGHTLETATLAMNMALSLQSLYGEEACNVDLVVAGAIVHDIGKIMTYKLQGQGAQMTDRGLLHDHILLGIEMLNEANFATQFRYQSAYELLVHIVASHHGKGEWGSPTTPKCIEAHLVHHADGISAAFDAISQANLVQSSQINGFTDRIYMLENAAHLLQKNIVERLGDDYAEGNEAL